MADSDGTGEGAPSEQQQAAARSILESVVDMVSPGATVPFESTDYGPSGELGFSYRNGSLMVEYQTDVDAADSPPDTAAAASELVELNDHTPLSAADEPYPAVERSAVELVAETVTDVPSADALEPVTVWPVANDPGLYRVGFEIRSKEFLYAVAFKIPPSAL